MRNENRLDNTTTVVHNKKDIYDVYIANPSKWSNPYRNDDTMTRTEKIEAYAKWVVKQENLMDDLHELEGKVLGCWCKPKACHGDVLAKLTNEKFGGSNTKTYVGQGLFRRRRKQLKRTIKR